MKHRRGIKSAFSPYHLRNTAQDEKGRLSRKKIESGKNAIPDFPSYAESGLYRNGNILRRQYIRRILRLSAFIISREANVKPAAQPVKF